MKLTESAKRLLVSMQLKADLSLKEVAQLLNCREHTARRAAAEIERSGFFIRKASLNLSRLGYTEYNLYLSFNSDNLSQRDRIISSLAGMRGVKWVLEVTSGFDLLVGFAARSPSEVTAFFEEIYESNGGFLLAKTVLAVVSYHYYGRRYLVTANVEGRSLDAEDTGTAGSVDEIDHKILRGLTHIGYQSIAQLERKLRIPASTIRLRIQKLSRLGIIVGMTYNLARIPPGLHVYRVHIYTRGGARCLLANLKKFARSDPSVVYIVKTLGPWDFELQYETLDPACMPQLGRKLVQAIGEQLLKVNILPVAGISKAAAYPF
ncbi:MAG: Lrp/AsnC family transcriptional regulator [Bdellovibrionota bacterium]|nr:MAG: Lrp/AsnC family transcriptional regulator [Bdellovibrionota bacterium]